MRKICVVTATRAEYGLLKRMMQLIEADAELELQLVVTGTHLLQEYGNTVEEIERDNLPIQAKISIINNKDEKSYQVMGNACYAFGAYFEKEKPDMLVVLGDRYELLPICFCAMSRHIPIAHISGGEITEGALDEAIRHSITKMSMLHFVGNEIYRKRVIQLGEEPKRVFNVGDPGVENVTKEQVLTKAELEESISWKLKKPFGIVTFHPTTLEMSNSTEQMEQLLSVLQEHDEMQFIITKSNADDGGNEINEMLDRWVEEGKLPNCLLTASLGMKRYLSALHYASVVIGNSSSGIVEAPSFGIPTVNIGDRQKGRLQASSILKCRPEKKEIDHALCYALSEEFQEIAKNTKNPYGSQDTAQEIVTIIKRECEEGNFSLAKKFYDVTFEIE